MFELRGIRAGYGRFPVLHDVTIKVPDGAIVAVIGPNGAGKTTMLRVSSGLLAPWAGRLTFDGDDVTGRQSHQMAELGICHVPEGRGIFRNLTVRENLSVFAGATDPAVALDRAVSAFPKLGQRLSQAAGTMSGGEQQMLALSRAYIRQPKVLLLDEVSMGLAPAVVNEIFEFLLRMTAEGTALLVVEQFVPKVLSVADYVFIMNRGRVLFAGEPAELGTEAVLRRYLGGEDQEAAASGII